MQFNKKSCPDRQPFFYFRFFTIRFNSCDTKKLTAAPKAASIMVFIIFPLVICTNTTSNVPLTVEAKVLWPAGILFSILCQIVFLTSGLAYC
jgi:hypothetical protein